MALQLLGALVFSVLLAFKAERLLPLDWWKVFVPVFVADGLTAYFTVIVFIRLYQDGEVRVACMRTLWVATVLSLKFVFEMLLCQKLVQPVTDLSFGLIMSPLFFLLQLLLVRACRVS
ncbi:transmembrane protein 203 isoform X2 [Lampetra planeri]|nr:transmembrane protein 203 isoform X2 [Petromyzon marinus]